jgi:hypothetical protein
MTGAEKKRPLVSGPRIASVKGEDQSDRPLNSQQSKSQTEACLPQTGLCTKIAS